MTAQPQQAEQRRGAIELSVSRRWLTLAVLLFFGLLVRVWAARWPPFPYDMTTWIAWGERLRSIGPAGFYEEGYFANYTPGYMYVLWLVAEVKHLLFESAGTNTYYLLHRTPAIICDLVIAWLIFRLVERAMARFAAPPAEGEEPWPVFPAIVAALWVFNPAVIFNSAVWGQVDSVFALPMLLAAIFLLNGRPELSMLTYGIALMIKPHAIVIAPVLGLALLFWFPWRRALRSIAIGAIAGIVLLLPFYGVRFIPRFWDLLANAENGFEYTSMNLWNLWGIYGLWKDDRLLLFGPISARGFGLGLFVLGFAYGLWWLWGELRRGADRTFTIFLFCSYFTFMPVMLLTLMRDRYLYPLLPFLLVFAALCYLLDEQPAAERDGRQRFLIVPLILYVGLTVIHTMNLYQVYQFYIHFETGGVPATNRLYPRIADNVKVWSALSLAALWAFAVLIPYWLGHGEPPAEPLTDAPPRADAPATA